MEEENGESEKEFPGLYASETSYRSDSDYNENNSEKGNKKELLKRQKKDKNKDKGYAALDAESSGEEMEYLDIKNPLKSKRPKSFKFLQKKDKEEKEREEKKDDKRKKEKDGKDDKKKEKKKEKEERKLREKEEKRRSKKEKKKKITDESLSYEDCKIFGAPLSIAVERNPSHDGIRLPAIVRECIDFVEEYGLSCEGIYRLGGVKGKVQALRRLYNSGEVVDLSDQHPHVVAALLKQYLRELPETILTVDMMTHFEDVSLIPNPRERAEAMRQLIDRLPTVNRLLLQYVLKHMGHVIERESETKMSSHSICVILSPTMQISHRVLNVMFHSHYCLFGEVQIRKYIPPITSTPGAKRSLDDLKTQTDVEEEIRLQESVLASLHAEIAAGKISQSKEEQLWEAQRIVTLLKRKLKTAQRQDTGESQHPRLSSFPEKDLSPAESQKEGGNPPLKQLQSKDSTNTASENDEEADKNSTSEIKSGSDTNTAGTPSFKMASNSDQISRKSSEEESDKSQPSSCMKKENSTKPEPQNTQHPKEQVIPILPKPLSARAERSKMGLAGREKAESHSSRKREESLVPSEHSVAARKLETSDQPSVVARRSESSEQPPVLSRKSELSEHSAVVSRKSEASEHPSVVPRKPEASEFPPVVARKPVPKAYQHPSAEISAKIPSTDTKRHFYDTEVMERVNKMSEISEVKTVSEASSLNWSSLTCSKERKVYKPVIAVDGKRRGVPPAVHQKPLSQPYSEDWDYSSLLREESRLHLEHEELLAMNQELTRKLQSEKTEVARLRDEIQEMQTLYGYRTHSYDSSESGGSESEGESDNEEEILKQIFSIDKNNKQIKLENGSLAKTIQNEREAIVQLRVALREAQSKAGIPPQIIPVC